NLHCNFDHLSLKFALVHLWPSGICKVLTITALSPKFLGYMRSKWIYQRQNHTIFGIIEFFILVNFIYTGHKLGNCGVKFYLFYIFTHLFDCGIDDIGKFVRDSLPNGEHLL